MKMKWFNGLMYDTDGKEYVTPMFKAVDANAAYQHAIKEYPEYTAVDVIYRGEEGEQ
jgi:hypothetical protein